MKQDPAIQFGFCDSQSVDGEGKPVYDSYKRYFATLEPDALRRNEIFDGFELHGAIPVSEERHPERQFGRLAARGARTRARSLPKAICSASAWPATGAFISRPWPLLAPASPMSPAPLNVHRRARRVRDPFPEGAEPYRRSRSNPPLAPRSRGDTALASPPRSANTSPN